MATCIAQAVLEEIALLLTVWLGNIVDLLEPDCIVVGGGVAEMMCPFFEKISANLPKWRSIEARRRDPPLMARYGADYVGIAGAAALCE